MTFHQLKNRIAFGEDLYTEFKRKLPEWPKLIREIVALANTEGGVVMVGVDDDGSIPGVKDWREIEEVLELKLGEYCRPAPVYQLKTVPTSGKRAVVVVHVARSVQKPHYALDAPHADRGTALIRIADSSVTCSKEMLELLKFESRMRDLKVEYGEKEARLMQLLEEATSVTVEGFAGQAGISKQTASRTLVHLTKANVLAIRPRIEAPDRFVLKEGFGET